MFPKIRMRRIRDNERLRKLSLETTLGVNDLILPLFIIDGKNEAQNIPSMPGVQRITVDLIEKFLDKTRVPAVLLFGVPGPEKKSSLPSAAFDDTGLIPRAIHTVKQVRPDIAIITDICLCAYTDHGHCGIVDAGSVDNDKTLPLLSKMALTHARAGADMVAPSAMMDGQVAAIRKVLDSHNFTETAIMSYAAKFASSFYGPFRDAAKSAPSSGDRSSYQLPAGNRQEAIRDALLDESEGADWLMVKPAMLYLDVIQELRQKTHLPIAAYQVSGEYAMIKFASNSGALDERKVVMESLISIKRAGANAIITYYAKEAAQWLSS